MAPEALPKGADNNGQEPRLIIVSNRLPVTISKDANGEYSFKVRNLGNDIVADQFRCLLVASSPLCRGARRPCRSPGLDGRARM